MCVCVCVCGGARARLCVCARACVCMCVRARIQNSVGGGNARGGAGISGGTFARAGGQVSHLMSSHLMSSHLMSRVECSKKIRGERGQI